MTVTYVHPFTSAKSNLNTFPLGISSIFKKWNIDLKLVYHSSIIPVASEAQARRLQVQDQSGQVTEILAPYKESKEGWCCSQWCNTWRACTGLWIQPLALVKRGEKIWHADPRNFTFKYIPQAKWRDIFSPKGHIWIFIIILFITIIYIL